MRAALDRLEQALAKDTTGGVTITTPRGEPWISVPPLGKQAEPANLGRSRTRSTAAGAPSTCWTC